MKITIKCFHPASTIHRVRLYADFPYARFHEVSAAVYDAAALHIAPRPIIRPAGQPLTCSVSVKPHGGATHWRFYSTINRDSTPEIFAADLRGGIVCALPYWVTFGDLPEDGRSDNDAIAEIKSIGDEFRARRLAVA